MDNSYSNQKILKFVITLGTNETGEQKTINDSNTIVLVSYRASIVLERAGQLQMGILQAKIYGVSADVMNVVTSLQWRNNIKLANSIEVFAIDGAVETMIFKGNMINAWADYSAMPNVFLHIHAGNAYTAQLTVAQPHSYDGAYDVATLMSQLATEAGMTVDNFDVKKQISNIYLRGSLLDQIRDLAKAADIELDISGDRIAIWNKGGYAENSDIAVVSIAPMTESIPVISQFTGMIGYPTYDGSGISTRVYFNPEIKVGGRVNVATDIKQINGIYVVMSITHHLDALIPNGAWFSMLKCNTLSFAPTR